MEAMPNFTDEQIEAGVLYSFACHHEEESRVLALQLAEGLLVLSDDAQRELNLILKAVTELLESIYPGDQNPVDYATQKIKVGYALLRLEPQLDLGSHFHDEHRAAFLDLFPNPLHKSQSWPPTKQTVATRLGDGLWSEALTNLGFNLNGRGLARKRLNKKQIAEWMEFFITYCLLSTKYPSESVYLAWGDEEKPALEDINRVYGSLHKAIWQNFDGDPFALLPPNTEDFM